MILCSTSLCIVSGLGFSKVGSVRSRRNVGILSVGVTFDYLVQGPRLLAIGEKVNSVQHPFETEISIYSMEIWDSDLL